MLYSGTRDKGTLKIKQEANATKIVELLRELAEALPAARMAEAVPPLDVEVTGKLQRAGTWSLVRALLDITG